MRALVGLALVAFVAATPTIAFADDGIVSAPGLTHVEPPPAPPPPPPRARWQVAIHGVLRATVFDQDERSFAEDAEAYGWSRARPAPLLGGSIDATYLHAPIVDVGLTAGWLRGTYAAGVDFDHDLMAVTATTIAATVRLHWARGLPFVPEPRLDVGLLRERITIHGEDATRLHPYLRAGVDWRLGTTRGGVNVALGYTTLDRDPDQMLAPPLGGLDFSAGPYLRF